MRKIFLICTALIAVTLFIIKSFSFDTGRVNSLQKKAVDLCKSKQYQKCQDAYGEAVSIYKDAGVEVPWWIISTMAVNYFFHMKQPEKAIPYGKMLLEYSDKKARITGLNWLSQSCFEAKKYEEFEKYALLYLEEGDDEKMKMLFSNYLSSYYYRQAGDFSKALTYAKKAGKDFWINRLLSPRTIVFTCRFNLRSFLKKYMSALLPGKVYLNMPLNTYYQDFVSLESSPSSAGLVKKGRYNYAEYDFSSGFPLVLELKITVRQRVLLAEPERLEPYADSSDEPGYFANHSFNGYDVNNPELIKTVNQITKGRSTNKEKAMALQDWISRNIVHFSNHPKYRNMSFAGLPKINDVDDLLKKKMGHCDHFSYLYAAMLRSFKIPARYIRGIQTAAQLNIDEGVAWAHTVVEVFDPDNKRWFFVEPQKYDMHFGQNESWLVIFETEMKEEHFKNLINMNYLFAMESKSFSDRSCIRFKVFQDL